MKLLGIVLGEPSTVMPIREAQAQDASPPPVPAVPDEAATAEASVTDASEVMPPPLPDSLEIGGSAAERAVLESLGERRKVLQEQEGQLDLREKLLQATEERLQKRVDELKSLEQRIEQVVDEKRKQEENEIAGLVTMYESMKAKDAARIFDRLELEVLLKVVRQMKPRKMADVLARMSPEAAERLTVAIARGGDDQAAVPASGSDLPKIRSN
ncbi:hypothetical protein SL003B_1542 [Polymorphum gilvum SL003B-26A1]|uniref:Magnesium transporter MgtE intracellular domain-containing protein n=1 Tax=Polymorphum gilvum (strain LMG 25793 / CGMCC 1.9160 / SL003B-26A1) TaxID=991905 RepID=F2J444_POLGS|nr:hypothetical protein SL003B_1542 [Polymorphum gilvum SL003B-26A1]